MNNIKKNTYSDNTGCQTSPSVLLDFEAASILAEARERSERDFLMICLALYAGLRNSEVIGLTIQILAPFGTVSNILDLPGTITKGKRERSIPLRIDVISDLNEFIKTKPERHEPTDPDSYIFVSEKTKKQLSPRDFQRITRAISLKVLNRPIHPHTFRHTFATNLLQRSNLRIVQIALGHRNIQNTSIYTHPSMSDVQRAIQGN